VKLNLQPLWVFVTAVRCESISRAARNLNISQPAASAYLKSLEDSLGLRLLERTSRGVRVSTEGEEICVQASRIFAQLEDLELHAAGRGEPRGSLCICASSTPGAYWLPLRLVKFRQRYPGVLTTLKLSDSAEVIESILRFQCPLGVVGELPELRGSTLHAEPVDFDMLALMCRPDNPLANIKRITHKSFSGQILIRREVGSSTRRLSDEVLAGYTGDFSAVMNFSRPEALRESILAGLGVGILSSWSAARELEDGGLCRVQDRKFWRRRAFYLIRRTDRQLRGVAGLLWQFLRASGSTAGDSDRLDSSGSID